MFMNILHSKIFYTFSNITYFIFLVKKRLVIALLFFFKKLIIKNNLVAVRVQFFNDILSKRTQFKTLKHFQRTKKASKTINFLKNWKVMQYKS
ncbi:MAG: hypothetical protein CM15mP87_11110 [Candidatus Neomarinimicrobiota bacterium]|nr:MAG: hypothetical protein CM15mP87_11110 [Candidatus Neomarinimicrobiota bacterium]